MIPPFKMVKSTIFTKKYFSGFIKTKKPKYFCVDELILYYYYYLWATLV